MIKIFKRTLLDDTNTPYVEGHYLIGNRSDDGKEVLVRVEKQAYDNLRELVDAAPTETEIAESVVAGEFLKDVEEAKKKYTTNVEEYRVGVYYHQGKLIKVGEKVYLVSRPHTSSEAWDPATTKDLYTLIGDTAMTEDEHPEWVEGSYPIGFKAWYEGKLYEVTQGDASGMNHWLPTEYGWEEVTA